VLMDCHMPVLDGFSATRRIRAAGNDRTPIIALTADVQQGIRERCEDAGMNGYLPKPFKQAELASILDTWLGQRADNTNNAEPITEPPPTAEGVFDPSAINELRRLSAQIGRDVHSKALKHFIEDTPGQLDQLRIAQAQRDVETVGRIAHTLKSASRTLGATALSITCAELEAACHAKQTDTSLAEHGARVERMVAQFQEVLPYMRAAINSSAAAEATQMMADNTPGIYGSAPASTPPPTEVAANTPVIHAGERSSPLILVVDDDAMFRDTTSSALEASGFTVATANSGQAALHWAADNVADLVLLDAVMQDFDGFTVCRQLRELWPQEETPILMVTGLDDVDSVEDAFDAGAAGFITKPVNYPILFHRIRFQLRAASDQRQLRQSQEKLHRAQQVARLGYWRWQIAEDRFEVSEHLQHLAGIPTGSASIHLHDYLEMIRPEDRRKVERAIRTAATETPQEAMDYQMATADQENASVLYQTLDYSTDDGGTVIGTVQDVSEQRAAEAMIRNLAYTDTLTGLRSRGYFQNYLESYIAAAVRHREHFGLLYMDLDGFKDINDSMGHDVGDQLLRIIANRLLKELRDSDIAARLGGDEFCVLIDDVDSDYIAASVAERFLTCINEPVQLGTQWVNPRVSIGIARFPNDGRDVSTLMKAADSAMYAAKHAGKHRYAFYEKDMTTHAERRLQLEQDLRQCVSNNQLVLHYQPQIELSTRRLAGVEALVRWNHPTRGMVPPGEFIDVAERIGFIDTLGEWVMRSACAQMVTWMQEGFSGFRVAVNVSPTQFRKDGFIDNVIEILETTGCPAHLLELEVTESPFHEGGEAALGVFQALHTIGV
ncbi:MAG: diguanylate cyclase, partial [Gammaproteobacteria bacterium]|nr:diguanylate cyclase [Gammaproteobacteria bacterium]